MLEIDVYFAVIFVSSFYKFVNIFKIIFQEFVVINIKTAAFYMGYEIFNILGLFYGCCKNNICLLYTSDAADEL